MLSLELRITNEKMKVIIFTSQEFLPHLNVRAISFFFYSLYYVVKVLRLHMTQMTTIIYITIVNITIVMVIVIIRLESPNNE